MAKKVKCLSCKEPVDVITQDFRPKLDVFFDLYTCKNPDCVLHGQTISENSYERHYVYDKYIKHKEQAR